MFCAGLSPLAIRIDDRCLLILKNINLKKNMKVRGGGQSMMASYFVQRGGGGVES